MSKDNEQPTEEAGGSTMGGIAETEFISNATPPALDTNDLKAMIAVINTARDNGAFKGAQLATVGGLYDKISRFLSWIDEAQKAAMEAADADETKDETNGEVE